MKARDQLYARARADEKAFQEWAINFFKNHAWSRFAIARMEAFVAKQNGEAYHNPEFPSLSFARYTNPYRMLDRGSQYVITEIANNEELGWRGKMTLLFLYRQFNMPSSYELFRDGVMAAMMDATGAETLDALVSDRKVVEDMAKAFILYHKDLEEQGVTLYSRAYLRNGSSAYTRYFELMPDILDTMFAFNAEDYSLERIFWHLRRFEGFGDFLAYQLALDVNYCFDVSLPVDFVVPGPGAIKGICDCVGPCGMNERISIIKVLAEPRVQRAVLSGFPFPKFFVKGGAPKGGAEREWLLEENDVQNLFCEFSKMYTIDVMQSRTKRFYEHRTGSAMSVVLPNGFVARGAVC